MAIVEYTAQIYSAGTDLLGLINITGSSKDRKSGTNVGRHRPTVLNLRETKMEPSIKSRGQEGLISVG